MSETQAATTTSPAPATQAAANNASAFSKVLERWNQVAALQSSLDSGSLYNTFGRAWTGFENMPQVQNMRVVGINPLPADYTKNDLDNFLRNPIGSEEPLQKISAALKYTNYPYQKILKTYTDIPTYRHYVMPHYLTKEAAKTEAFMREWRLVDKLEKEFDFEAFGHQAAGQAATTGKVFYITRYDVDKTHNKVDYLFHQQLPTHWCRIIGFNNISKYTVSFNMMYFLQAGTDYTQFGTLFEPYIRDFMAIFEPPKETVPSNYLYARKINVDGKQCSIYPNQVRENAAGNPEMFQQNGTWCYYVSLPIDRVWTFELDDTTAINAPIFSGLMETFAQQGNYEAAQLSLILNPLIKVFTGEIPYSSDEQADPVNKYRLSEGARLMFETYFDRLMNKHNTSGTALYSAPLQNIKSHDFSESANANEISETFLQYGMSQAGLTSLISVSDSPHQGFQDYSGRLESRFTERVYVTLEKMFNHMIDSLNLKYDWRVKVFGSIYTEDVIRSNAMKMIDKGDTTQHYILAALDGMTVLDKLCASTVLSDVGYLDTLIPPATAYTQSGKSGSSTTSSGATGTSAQGAPTKTETEVKETKQEKTTTATTTGD